MSSFDRNRFALFVGICIFIVAAAEVSTVITSIPPSGIAYPQLMLFFGSLWVVCTGFFLALWSLLKKVCLPTYSSSPLVTLRQAGLMSLLPVGGLFLNSLQLLRVWEAVPLALSLVLLELFFEAETPIK